MIRRECVNWKLVSETPTRYACDGKRVRRAPTIRNPDGRIVSLVDDPLVKDGSYTRHPFPLFHTSGAMNWYEAGRIDAQVRRMRGDGP